MMRSAIGILLAILSTNTLAQTPPSSTSREIMALFSVLEKSHCQFNRNGRWYNPVRASDHLHRKYDYLLQRHLVTTTESFIDLAASKSSFSGRPYLVQCANEKVVSSKTWFMAQLLRLRMAPNPLRGSA